MREQQDLFLLLDVCIMPLFLLFLKFRGIPIFFGKETNDLFKGKDVRESMRVCASTCALAKCLKKKEKKKR